MAIAQLPQRVASAGERTSHADSLDNSAFGLRFLAVSSLAAGAILLITGRRTAALGACAAAATMALIEDPRYAGNLWKSVPSCIQAGKRMLARVEGFVEDVEIQRERLHALVQRAQLR